MKAMRYIIALVLSGVACWLNAAMNDWDLLRNFMIAPISAYSVKVAMLAVYANMGLVTYLSALLAGLSLGSWK